MSRPQPHATLAGTGPEPGTGIAAAIRQFRQPVALHWDPGRACHHAELTPESGEADDPALLLVGHLPPLFPEWLGDPGFLLTHQLRFPYVAGEMARGLSSVAMVTAMAENGMLGFFGAAGLAPEAVGEAIAALQRQVGPDRSWGVNLIHSPGSPGLEDALVDLFLARGVRRVSVSAFMALAPAVVRYAASGLHRGPDGTPVRRNHLFAKLSRPEVAQHFMRPPPPAMLQALVDDGGITAAEAAIAATLPVAGDIVAEGDSGGHTDGRPLLVLLPMLLQQRDALQALHRLGAPSRIGAAGGLGTPAAVAAAFAAGAAFVVTGSVNQACIQSGLSAEGRAMLAEAGLADTAMAPSADMFEIGAKVQVLRKGTLFAQRATRLHELYRSHGGLEEIPTAVRDALEATVFRRPLAAVWDDTRAFWARHDPATLARAEANPKLRMALVFRWYLGLSSRWPITGAADRRTDFQIWCGPAMGGFNAWTRDSFMADHRKRCVVQVALNLLEGAAQVTRARQFRSFGVALPPGSEHFAPRPLALTETTA